MEDVKDKMKNLMKKVNKPFSSSSAFKGQARTIGSSTPNPSSSSRLIPNPKPIANKSDENAAICIANFLSRQPSDSSVETLIKLLRNVAREPENERFRRIRMGNPRIEEAVGGAAGGAAVLECAGFRIEEEGGERWAKMGELTAERIRRIRDLILGLEKWEGRDDEVVGNGVVERELEMMIDRKVV